MFIVHVNRKELFSSVVLGSALIWFWLRKLLVCARVPSHSFIAN